MKVNLSQSIPIIFSAIRKHPWLIFVTITLLVVYVWIEIAIKRPSMSIHGIPKITSQIEGNWMSHILRKEAFMLEYSEGLKNPLWVVYKVKQDRTFKTGKRPSRFQSDPWTLSSINHDDYTGSGFDRGHMAPNFAIASRYGRSAQLDTFLMTNISPQKPKLNQKLWQRLEEVISDKLSKKYGDLWVFTGPIFNDSRETLKRSNVIIPAAFYKIIVRTNPNNKTINTLSFVMPQNVSGKESLLNFVRSIDEVEALTHIDFLHELDDSIENTVESSTNLEAWDIKPYANLPSRF